jgi:hypothetical protein
MNLKYRGVEYRQSEPLILEVQEKELIGSYRGVNCYHTHFDASVIPQPSHPLRYRGVEYQSGRAIAPQVQPQPSVEPLRVDLHTAANSDASVHQVTPVGMQPLSRQARLREQAELDRVHIAFLRQKLEHRLSVAQDRGDRHLIQQLEQERSQLV